jgi:hypothetical protein
MLTKDYMYCYRSHNTFVHIKQNFIVMKTVYLIIAAFLLHPASFSQSLELDIAGTEKVRINDLYGDLKISANNSESIKIEITGHKNFPDSISEAEPRQYKPDNTQLGINIEKKERLLIVSAAHRQAQFTNYRISIPKNIMIEIRNKFPSKSNGISLNKNNGRYDAFMNNITLRGFKNEIDINVFASDLKLNNVTGPLAISAFYGDFNINFLKLNQDNPSQIELFNGNIKVNLPYDTKSIVALNSESGYIQTDFTIKKATVTSKNIRTEKSRVHGVIFRKYSNANITGIINKKGTSLNITAYNGNIKLLRKDYTFVPFYIYTN